jgi:hypothetical protein
MDMITAEEVARRIDLYFDGGVVAPLNDEQWQIAASVVSPARSRPAAVRRRA